MSNEYNAKLPAVRGIISATDKARLDYFVKDKGFTISRLVAIAVHNELRKDKPFEWSCELPDDEVVEYAYVEQAGRILNYLKNQKKATPLDFLLLIRDDIGVPGKYEFLMAFKDCLDKGMILRQVVKVADRSHEVGDILYISPENTKKEKKAVRRKADKYSRYQKLRKEFGDS